MAVINGSSAYDFIKSFKVQTAVVPAVDIMQIQPSSVIENVWVRMITPAVRTAGGVNLLVGDDDDDDGYIVASDAKGAAGTVYGDGLAEIGAYLASGGVPLPNGKIYLSSATTKELKIVLSADVDSEAVVQVTVKGYAFTTES